MPADMIGVITDKIMMNLDFFVVNGLLLLLLVGVGIPVFFIFFGILTEKWNWLRQKLLIQADLLDNITEKSVSKGLITLGIVMIITASGILLLYTDLTGIPLADLWEHRMNPKWK